MTHSVTFPSELHLLKHPYYQAWMEGTLSMATLHDYAQQYHHHVEAFPRYLSRALSQCRDEEVKAILAENLAEEDGTAYGTSHPELWLRFAEGLGLDRSTVENAAPREAIQGVVNTFAGYAGASLAEALGSLYAYESQVPEIAHSKIEGLQRNYGIQDERTLSFFEVHKHADIEHREKLRSLLDRLTAEQKAAAQAAADRSAQALWNFLSDVHRAHC